MTDTRNREIRTAITTAIFWSLLLSAGGSLALSLYAEPGPQKSQAVRDYALIFGTVWGPDDRPVPGVPITIRRATDKKPKWELTSDNRGEFAQRVPPGRQDYIVRATIKMPKGQPQPEITVQIDDNERKDIGLHLITSPSARK
jgi:hypothetical protein